MEQAFNSQHDAKTAADRDVITDHFPLPPTPGTRPSLRERIDAKCKACVYDPHAKGTWREQVADCRGTTCELYDVRPLPLKRSRLAA